MWPQVQQYSWNLYQYYLIWTACCLQDAVLSLKAHKALRKMLRNWELNAQCKLLIMWTLCLFYDLITSLSFLIIF